MAICKVVVVVADFFVLKGKKASTMRKATPPSTHTTGIAFCFVFVQLLMASEEVGLMAFVCLTLLVFERERSAAARRSFLTAGDK